MTSETQSTQQAILAAGKQEFLEYGFEKASLRVIAKRAGVTTGAIYGYFPDKASLFDAIVTEPAEILYDRFRQTVDRFESFSLEEQQEQMGTMTQGELSGWLDHVYAHFDAFKLIICRSAGTRWESYLDSLIEVEEESTRRFIERLKEAGKDVPDISQSIMHMLASAYFSTLDEIFSHELPREVADEHFDVMSDFFTAGWEKILGFRD